MLIIYLSVFAAAVAAPAPYLTLTGTPTEMAVSWSEPGDATSKLSQVRYGLTRTSLDQTATSPSRTMQTKTEANDDYCGGPYETHTLHMVHLTDLPADTDVYYSVGDNAAADFEW